ncbi:MAG: metalloregulator ArsR/SmtB family transcription factor [Patescibacteria group bacterium]
MNMRSYFEGAGCRCRALPRLERPPKALPNGIARTLRLLAAPARFEILLVLAAGPHVVSDVVGHVGRSQTLVSHHLASLELGGLVGSVRRGRRVEYHLTRRGRRAAQAIFAV